MAEKGSCPEEGDVVTRGYKVVLVLMVDVPAVKLYRFIFLGCSTDAQLRLLPRFLMQQSRVPSQVRLAALMLISFLKKLFRDPRVTAKSFSLSESPRSFSLWDCRSQGWF